MYLQEKLTKLKLKALMPLGGRGGSLTNWYVYIVVASHHGAELLVLVDIHAILK